MGIHRILCRQLRHIRHCKYYFRIYRRLQPRGRRDYNVSNNVYLSLIFHPKFFAIWAPKFNPIAIGTSIVISTATIFLLAYIRMRTQILKNCFFSIPFQLIFSNCCKFTSYLCWCHVSSHTLSQILHLHSVYCRKPPPEVHSLIDFRSTLELIILRIVCATFQHSHLSLFIFYQTHLS